MTSPTAQPNRGDAPLGPRASTLIGGLSRAASYTEERDGQVFTVTVLPASYRSLTKKERQARAFGKRMAAERRRRRGRR